MPFAETTRGRIYYEVYGDGPPLVIAPAFGATSRSYRSMLPNLVEVSRVVLYDMLGMGQSDAMPDDATLADVADNLTELLDHLGIGRTSVLGLSMGAITAQHFAVRHRDRLDRLILVAPPAGTSPYRRAINRIFTDLLKAQPPERLMEHMLYLALSPDFVDQRPALVEQIAKSIVISERDRQTLLRLLEKSPRFTGVPGLEDMDAPTLIIAGQLDILTPPSQARRLHALLPNSRLVLLEGVAHSPFLEAGQQTFSAVRAFLTGERACSCRCTSQCDSRNGEADS